MLLVARAWVPVSWLVVLIGTLACSHAHRDARIRETHLSLEIAQSIQSVAVLASETIPALNYTTPKTREAVAKAWFKEGVDLFMIGNPDPRDVRQEILCLVTLPFCLAAAGVAGGLAAGLGAAVAPSEDAVEDALSRLRAAVADLGGSKVIAELFREQIRDRAMRRAALLIGPASANAAPASQRLAEGVDAVLEQGPLVVSLGTRGGRGIDPAQLLSVTLPIWLIGHDGTELYAYRADYVGSDAHTLLEWGASGARLFRDELAKARTSVVTEVVEQLFPCESSEHREEKNVSE